MTNSVTPRTTAPLAGPATNKGTGFTESERRELGLPVVHDPTVGDAIEQYSDEYRGQRGVYLSIDRPDDIEISFTTLGLGPDDVDIIVCSDAEEILGIGDQGTPTTSIGSWTLAEWLG